MNKCVRVVFDRKGSVAKTGNGKVEILVYLSRTQRKYESVGESTPDMWEVVAWEKSVVTCKSK